MPGKRVKTMSICLPDGLRARIRDEAAADGISVSSWISMTISRALRGGDGDGQDNEGSAGSAE